MKSLLAIENYTLSPSTSPLTLYNSLTDFDYLFFIRYLPENTLKSCWFLVQVNHVETTILNMNSKRIDDYHVTYISQHPKDSHLCADTARWWSLWHKYKNDKTNIHIYGACMLFGPKRKLDPNKYILWKNLVNLAYPSCYWYDPFNFGSQSDVITAKQYVALTHWEYL